MKILHDCKEITLKSEVKTGQDVLRELKVDPHTVLIIKNKQVVTDEEPLSASDSIEVLSVASGG